MKEAMLRRIKEDPDFINCKRHDNSLQKLLEANPNGCTDRTIAQALMVEESAVEKIYQDVVSRFRAMLISTDDTVH